MSRVNLVFPLNEPVNIVVLVNVMLLLRGQLFTSCQVIKSFLEEVVAALANAESLVGPVD